MISVPDLRWKRRDIKTVQLLAASLARREAERVGARKVARKVVVEGA